ncbi:uracil-DNA glycosylase [Candidatus Liberibacter solanacearum]|uniref:Uracil-DNA glycosylase n=1 Tax=Candidatus Liberibacter solanacearum TaxID=556287 RepID=A0A094Z4B9_9HYPH|nr:uracil-DNA glycosylase [Candidatus Liberibacter solanacearum]KGB27734.1 uracil-DNA glycosylase [Candidatus Liberibacter solanacearum]KJZ81473.1 uracil-DNA glycosylase [Candidatus Liberibacter solanacearum]KJZ82611.1 Uracil-DNA glycosylase, family 1 [Candidatus Liberibacter solanacearum]KQC49107.1 uracil-DNA glycosylase [Candidatus Liberibacter solanacearum]
MEGVKIHESWKALLESHFKSDYMHNLKEFLLSEKRKGKRIFPKGSHYFHAFNITPFIKVKVVIIGQDPYHGYGQAHGLCFSVPLGIRIPPSLVNVYKELQEDVDFIPPIHGFLEHWGHEGVLLLNTVLTVEEGRAASHRGQGWEQFTDSVIELINKNRKNVVFMLWGASAHKKQDIIDNKRHLVLKAAHPSPLSARYGFFGCRHFSQANQYLQEYGQTPINWQIP